jgi:ABC-type uncharacterized transport system substrate-binding protein
VVADAIGTQSTAVVAALTTSHHTVRVQSVSDGLPMGLGDDVVVLAVGKKSARAVALSPITHKAALFVSHADAPPNLAAVVVDVPFADQLAWIAHALPGRSRVVVARHSARGPVVDPTLKAAAAAAGLTLLLVDVAAPGEAVPAVAAALDRPGARAVLLLLADDAVVTADTIAPLMQAAFRSRTPVVGFSSYFAKVGAVAVVTTDAAVMANEAIALAISAAPGAATIAHVSSASAGLLVDGRLAERLGIPVTDGPHIEVRR